MLTERAVRGDGALLLVAQSASGDVRAATIASRRSRKRMP
jgi:hypothetical protein